jgi:hypothetical protein
MSWGVDTHESRDWVGGKSAVVISAGNLVAKESWMGRCEEARAFNERDVVVV